MSFRLLRRLLFCLPPETAHGLALSLLRAAASTPPGRALLRAAFGVPRAALCPVEAFGLTFPHAVGLASGYDKDALGWRGLACLGFGHIEVGTVTPRAQCGNARPRLFRLPAERALINRMGFPSRGAAFVARRLRARRPPGLIVGVNLGKQKETPLEEAANDYELLIGELAGVADYLTINISSPNTPGLRRLQARSYLEALLGRLDRRRRQEVDRLGRGLPLLVKLAPDLSSAELDEALEAICGSGVDGVIATNTTVARPAGLSGAAAEEAGGLSGAPLAASSTEMIRAIHARTGGRLPIIGAGGVFDGQSARAKLEAGASLVQVYTGLVYQGPGLARRIARALV